MRLLLMPNGAHFKVRAILAMDINGVIGYDGRLIFNNPKDLNYFKERTKGNVCIMGRKTFESIGRVLPGRQTVIMTRNVEATSEIVAKMVEKHPLSKDTPYPVICARISEIVSSIAYDMNDPPILYVCGGATIYRLFQNYVELWMVTRYDINLELHGRARGYLPDDFDPKKLERVDPGHLHNYSWTISEFDSFEGIPIVYRNYMVIHTTYWPYH